MALTRITSNVIKDNTIEEGKFNKPYLDSSNADTAQQAITFQSNVDIQSGAGPVYFSASNNLVSLTGSNVNAAVLSVVAGGITLTNGDITLVEPGRKITTPILDVGSGTVTNPGLYFSGVSGTGFYLSLIHI